MMNNVDVRVEKIKKDHENLMKTTSESVLHNKNILIEYITSLMPTLGSEEETKKREALTSAQELIASLTEEILEANSVEDIQKIRKKLNYYINKIGNELKKRNVAQATIDEYKKKTGLLKTDIAKYIRVFKRKENISTIENLYGNYENLDSEELEILRNTLKRENRYYNSNTKTEKTKTESKNAKKLKNTKPNEYVNLGILSRLIKDNHENLMSMASESVLSNKSKLTEFITKVITSLTPEKDDKKREALISSQELIASLTEEILEAKSIEDIQNIRKKLNYYINKISAELKKRNVDQVTIDEYKEKTKELRKDIAKYIRFFKRKDNIANIEKLYANYENLTPEELKTLRNALKRERRYYNRNIKNKKTEIAIFEEDINTGLSNISRINKYVDLEMIYMLKQNIYSLFTTLASHKSSASMLSFALVMYVLLLLGGTFGAESYAFAASNDLNPAIETTVEQENSDADKDEIARLASGDFQNIMRGQVGLTPYLSLAGANIIYEDNSTPSPEIVDEIVATDEPALENNGQPVNNATPLKEGTITYTNNSLAGYRELTFEEMELIARYKFDLLDDNDWKWCVGVIACEAGEQSFNESIDVSSVVLNRLITPRWIRSNPGNFRAQLNLQQFTVSEAKVRSYMAKSLEELRQLGCYKGIVQALYNEIPNNEYSQFRYNGYDGGVLLNNRGNKYLDSVSGEAKIPLEERGYYKRIVEALNDPNSEFYHLIMAIDPSTMESLSYYFANKEAEISPDDPLGYENYSLTLS